MKFICEKCSTKYSIADEKVRRKVLKIRCKNCGNIIVVRDPQRDQPDLDFRPADVDKALDKAFDGAFDAPRGSRPSGGLAAAAGGAPGSFPGLHAVPGGQAAPKVVPARAETPEPADEWFLAVDGHQFGPMSFAELASRVKRGEGRGETGEEGFVWRDGFDDWIECSAVPELRAYAPPPLPRPSGSFPMLREPEPPQGQAPPPTPLDALQPRRPVVTGPQQPAGPPIGDPGFGGSPSGAPAVPAVGTSPDVLPAAASAAAGFGSADFASTRPSEPPPAVVAGVPDTGGLATGGPGTAIPTPAPVSAPPSEPALAAPSSALDLPAQPLAAGEAALSQARAEAAFLKRAFIGLAVVLSLAIVLIVWIVLREDDTPKQPIAITMPQGDSPGAQKKPTTSSAEESENGQDEEREPTVEETAVKSESSRRATGSKRPRTRKAASAPQPAKPASEIPSWARKGEGGVPDAIPDSGKRRGSSSTGGEPTSAEVNRLASQGKKGVKTCYNRVLKRVKDPALLEFKAEVTLTVGASGKVLKAGIKGVSDPELNRCFRGVYERLALPRSIGRKADIAFSVSFRAGQ